MANASVSVNGTGVSFFDPLGTALEGFLTGGINDYYSRKSEQRSYQRQRDLMNDQFALANLYAENQPSWHVRGLRKAGINPIIAFSKGTNVGGTLPSLPSASLHATSPSFTSTGAMVKHDPLVREEYRTKRLHNAKLEDNLETQKAENEVRRLKAEAEASLLRPITSTPYEGDDKAVSVQLPSKHFKALQKGIADDYDLRSERYIRETTDAVMKHGVDVLKLLPVGRKVEILKRITHDNDSRPFNSSGSSSNYTRNRP